MPGFREHIWDFEIDGASSGEHLGSDFHELASTARPPGEAHAWKDKQRGSRAILSEDERRPASEGSGHPCSWKHGGCQQTNGEA